MPQLMDAVGNEYGKPKDVAGEQRTVFTSLADAAFDVCFENVLAGSTSTSLFSRRLSITTVRLTALPSFLQTNTSRTRPVT
jgi:hypothetical protein